MSEFPKLLWSPEGAEVTVADEAEQAAKLAEGYRLTAEAPVAEPSAEVIEPVSEPPAELPEPEPDEPEGPTFGGPQDASFGEDAKAKKKTAGKKK